MLSLKMNKIWCVYVFLSSMQLTDTLLINKDVNRTGDRLRLLNDLQ
jgi:hypothetical protein